MCTASWIQNADRLALFFNRDERRDRPTALPPRVSETHGVRVIAPRDALAGGTWIFANEAGSTAALLNYYPENNRDEPEGPIDRWTSRGRLLRDLSHHGTTSRVNAALHVRLASERFKPFRLLWFGPGGERVLWTWDGEHLARIIAPLPPLTTSAWNPGAVRRERLRLFTERVSDWETATPENLEESHVATSPAGSAFGVLMDRDDARKVSLCRVDIDPSRVRMTYWPRLSGGRFGTRSAAELPRTNARSARHPHHERLSSCP